MAISVSSVYEFLDQRAPFSMQMDFDNSGFLVGHREAEVSRILVALDITDDVIAQGIEGGFQLIVAHHPIIFGKIGSITDQDQTGRKVLRLIEHGIAAICAHTNLDAAEGGVNSVLAQRLGLSSPVPLHTDGMDAQGRPYGIGRVGRLEGGPISLDRFVERIKAELLLDSVRVLDCGRAVSSVAVGGGACGSMLADVLAHGCDTFVTSELKHDVYLEAKALGINLIDAGHYATEAVICPVLQSWLQEAFPGVTVSLAKGQREVFSCW